MEPHHWARDLIAGVIGAGGLAAMLPKILEYMRASRADKTSNENKLYEDKLKAEQALVDMNRKRIESLEVKLQACEEGHEECRAENAAVREKIGRLEGRIEEIERRAKKHHPGSSPALPGIKRPDPSATVDDDDDTP